MHQKTRNDEVRHVQCSPYSCNKEKQICQKGVSVGRVRTWLGLARQVKYFQYQPMMICFIV